MTGSRKQQGDASMMDDTTNELFTSSLSQVMSELSQVLMTYGYQLMGGGDGPYCGFHVYQWFDPKDTFPWTPHYRRLGTTELEMAGFLSALRVALGDMLKEAELSRDPDHGADLDKYKTYLDGIYRQFSDQRLDKHCRVAKYSVSAPTVKLQRSLTAKEGVKYHSFVIPKTRFPASLQTLDPKTLLTRHMGDAEANLLMLTLGRTAAGSRRSKPIEAKTKLGHTWRNYVILTSEGGIGKSSVIEAIKDAFQSMGYRYTNMAQDDTKFGWGQIAKSDIAISDDLNERSHKMLLHSDKVKTIVSSGSLRTEQKGIDAVDTDSDTVIVACSNITNPMLYLNVDDGSLKRVCHLYLWSRAELRAKHGDEKDMRTWWLEIADSHGLSGTPQEKLMQLAAYLISHSLDVFMDAIGWQLDKGWYKPMPDMDPNRLMNIVEDYRKELVFGTGLKHVEQLVDHVYLGYLWAYKAADDYEKKYIEALAEMVYFTPELLYELIQAYKPEGLNAGSLIPKTLLFVANTTMLDRFQRLVKSLISEDGIGYPQSMSQYIHMLRKRLTRLKYDEPPASASRVSKRLGTVITKAGMGFMTEGDTDDLTVDAIIDRVNKYLLDHA